MQRISDKPSGLRSAQLEGVEVRLWEIYLLRSRTNLRNILASYSIDNGPREPEGSDTGRITYRFTSFDWDRSILQLLRHDNIPFEIVTNFAVDYIHGFRKKKVYVVEDDLNILFALNTVLEEAGYDVLLTHCAGPIMDTNLPATDVFILDRQMHDINGIDVCRHLRKQEVTRNTPVIMISASGNVAAEAFEAGANDFLKKPFPMKDIVNLVAKYTDDTKVHGGRSSSFVSGL